VNPNDRDLSAVTRYIAIFVESSNVTPERLKVHPNVELYFVEGPDAENEIDMALLNDLVCPIELAFVGGAAAKAFAASYGSTWIENTPTVENDLLRFWGIG
jgi:hypothetical protein